jgi:hypothetical protein
MGYTLSFDDCSAAPSMLFISTGSIIRFGAEAVIMERIMEYVGDK